MEPVRKYATTEEIIDAAAGRWLDIFHEISPNLRPAINKLSKNPKSAHVPCPVHGGTDGFRLFEDADQTGVGICSTCGTRAGIKLIAWVEDWDYLEAKDAVADLLGMLPDGSGNQLPESRIVEVTKVPPLTPEQGENRRKKLNALWHESLSVNHPSAEPLRLYLARRGLRLKLLNPKVFRYHPNLPYISKGEVLGRYPAWLALFTNLRGERVTIHRTYLTPSGRKLELGDPKIHPSRKVCEYDKLKHSLKGSVVKLTRPGVVLSAGEGLESMLSVLEAARMPTWAATTANLLETMEIPSITEEVWIWEDKDASKRGREASRNLCERMWAEGKRARIIPPPGKIPHGQKSLDWNDILRMSGVAGFPKVDPRVQLQPV